MKVSVDKLLVSSYVSEKGDNRRNARMANIATMFLELYKTDKKVVSTHYLRKQVRERLNLEDLSGEALNGDHRANGDAYGKQGLKLDTTIVGNKKYILFSLPNLVRCSKFLLGGDCRPTGATYEARLNLKSDMLGGDSDQFANLEELEDNELINLLTEIKKLSKWENDFVVSLDRKWREDGLSPKQRSKAIQIIEEKYAQ